MHDRGHFVSNRTLKLRRAYTVAMMPASCRRSLPVASVDAAKVDGIVSPARSASPKRPTAN